MRATAHRAADKAGGFQRLHMLGSAGEAHLEGGGKLADAALATGEGVQHASPGRIGEGVEDGVEGLLFNHKVEYSGPRKIIQPFC